MSTPQQKPAIGPEEDQASLRLGIELYAPGPPRRRWPGFRSRGGRGRQEALIISPVSGWAGRASRPPPCLRLLEPVALAVELQNMDMMSEAIEQRTGEPRTLKNARPFLEWKIRCDDGRAVFVTLAEYFKQKLCAGL